LSPEQRIALLDRFVQVSAEFAAARGYGADLGAMRQELVQTTGWQPTAVLTRDLVERVQQARLQCERLLPPAGLPSFQVPPVQPTVSQTSPQIDQPHVQYDTDASPRRPSDGGVTLRIRARPWLRRLLRL
jgi:hypothetical protein